MVRDFQGIIGKEIKEQLSEKIDGLPDICVACVGGGSNAIGMFTAFLNDPVELVGVEAGGYGPDSGKHAIRMSGLGRVGIVQAYKSFFLQDDNGSLLHTHSISAGLDYAGIGPQLAHLAGEGRIVFTHASDTEVLEAISLTARQEGIIPALESAHALVEAFKRAKELAPDKVIVVNISGRGDKDLFITAPHFDRADWLTFLRDEQKRLTGEGN
jgi:tryptophan synthase beta chain